MWKHLIVLFGGFYDPGYRSACMTFWLRPLLSLRGLSYQPTTSTIRGYSTLKSTNGVKSSLKSRNESPRTCPPRSRSDATQSEPALAVASRFCPHRTALSYTVRPFDYIFFHQELTMVRILPDRWLLQGIYQGETSRWRHP